MTQNKKVDWNEYVWYASYGSNMKKSRFLCYIKGGVPEGSTKEYSGCRDNSAPIDIEELFINSQLYFAKKSKTWNKGGVAFIKNEFGVKYSTYSRMYRITQNQFIDVLKQETNTQNELIIDFDKARMEGSLIVKKRSWYGKLIYLGEQDGSPIFTFTNEKNLNEFVKPDPKYLKTIIEGIDESHEVDQEALLEYLKNSEGISGNYSDDEIMNLLSE